MEKGINEDPMKIKGVRRFTFEYSLGWENITPLKELDSILLDIRKKYSVEKDRNNNKFTRIKDHEGHFILDVLPQVQNRQVVVTYHKSAIDDVLDYFFSPDRALLPKEFFWSNFLDSLKVGRYIRKNYKGASVRTDPYLHEIYNRKSISY